MSLPLEPVRQVRHSGGSYPVYVAVGALARVDGILDHHLKNRDRFTLTDDLVGDELLQWASESDHPWRTPGTVPSDALANDPLVFPHGEASKTRETWRQLSDQLLTRGAGRDAAIVALGGGVVGDLAGFVAATYMRGIPVLHIPTTVVAMVDSAIGGKTGVDTDEAKNLIGAFHHPAAVLADPRVLLTLPEREFCAGLAEVVKHALIADADHFQWLEDNAREISARDLDFLTEVVCRSVTIKADIVEQDEREGGRRAQLNLGHTVGHGIEQASGYRLLHGEAVALGLVTECALASDMGLAEKQLGQRAADLLARFDLPTRLPSEVSRDRVLTAMAFDKKRVAGDLRFALPAGLGVMARPDGEWTVAADVSRVTEAIARLYRD